KPKPFSELNHFTVPCAMTFSFCRQRPHPEMPEKTKYAPAEKHSGQAHIGSWVPQLQQVHFSTPDAGW
ncbi:hypothetical protein AB1388_20120, partial [Streptomyces hydrogenans]|uniref:hypothetical protein n=1 Tax=Streptomyces hydrogenans TaxID=1873719 RepID=UPI00345D45A4